ncbi:hypothetical protein RQP46_007352 [Phenoliferia psychrophenolica]
MTTLPSKSAQDAAVDDTGPADSKAARTDGETQVTVVLPPGCSLTYHSVRLYERKAALINFELDTMGLGRYQKCIWVLCGFGYGLDLLWAEAFGLSNTYALTRTGLYQEMNVKGGAQADIFTAFSAGLTVGAFTWGLLVDIIGRRYAFNLTCLLTSLFGMLVAAPFNYTGICVLTALCGFGLGGNVTVCGCITLGVFMLRFAVFTFFESPKFLIARGRDAEAVAVVHSIAAFNRQAVPKLRVEDLQAIDLEFKDRIDDSLNTGTSTSALGVLRQAFGRFKHLKGLFRTSIYIYLPGIIGTALAAAAVELPGIGRKWSLVFGAIVQGVSMAMYTQVTTIKASVGLNALEYIMRKMPCAPRPYIDGNSNGVLWLACGGIFVSALFLIALPIETRHRTSY